jgi:HK97 family phage prohead protease
VPWRIEKREGQFCVIKETDGSVEKCHETREQALAHQRALYASENRSVETRAVDNSEWDGNAAMSSAKTASDYRAICAGERTAGEPDERAHWALPHHKRPGSPPNAAGVRNALSRLPQTQGLKNAGAAKAHLQRHMSEIGGGDERMAPMEGVELRSSTITEVDTRQRIIDLIAVPWGEEGEVMWRGEPWREVFVRGAFDGIEDHAGRVPVNHEHVRGKTIGKMVKFTNGDEGLLGRVKVGRTPLGDDMLNLADEDMVSASIGFRVAKPSDVDTNKRTRLRRVMRAFIDHVALTESPVYEGARVLAVRAEQSGLQVVEQEPLPSTPALDEFRDDEVFAWARQRLEGRP